VYNRYVQESFGVLRDAAAADKDAQIKKAEEKFKAALKDIEIKKQEFSEAEYFAKLCSFYRTKLTECSERRRVNKENDNDVCLLSKYYVRKLSVLASTFISKFKLLAGSDFFRQKIENKEIEEAYQKLLVQSQVGLKGSFTIFAGV